MSGRKQTIWIDLENTPHVPFFLPIVRELEQSGCNVLLTARDFAQTVELARRAGLMVTVIGKGGGSGGLKKTVAVLSRSLRLAWLMRRQQINLAVGHGSRGLLIASRLLRIPSLTLYDYEGASVSVFNRLSSFVMTPELIPTSELLRRGLREQAHFTYPGLKEEVYLSDFQASTTLPVRLGLRPTDINVVVRPPSATAHYRSASSESLFRAIMTLLSQREDVHVVLLPRDSEQRASMIVDYGKVKNVTIPERAVDGASLLYYSDLVIGGGGTMNREAAVLGVPVVSIFKGEEGAVDRHLKAIGALVDIDDAQHVLPFLTRRDRRLPKVPNTVKMRIVELILNLANAK